MALFKLLVNPPPYEYNILRISMLLLKIVNTGTFCRVGYRLLAQTPSQDHAPMIRQAAACEASPPPIPVPVVWGPGWRQSG